MKFSTFHIEERLCEDSGGFQWLSPEYFGVRLHDIKSIDYTLAEQIKAYCEKAAVYHIADLIYFESEDDRLLFLLWCKHD